MLAIKIWNYLNGYVIIRIEGLSLERLLNLALTKNIYLWDIKRLNKYQVDVCIHLKSQKSLKELIDYLGCKETILHYKGLPFLLKRLKKRKLFVMGFLMFFLCLGFLSSFLWDIEINGAEQTDEKEIIAYLNENKIRTGKFKRVMPSEDIKKLLIEEYDYFSFIEAQYRGVKLVIDIKEEDIPPDKVDTSTPANIIARNRGVITKIINKNGETVAEVGEIVDVGDVVIRGIIRGDATEGEEDQEEEQHSDGYLVHAEGEVWARTRYEKTVEDYVITSTKKETGNVKRHKGLKINDRGIHFSDDIPYENYEEHKEEKNLIDFSFLSIDFVKIIDYEYREVEIEEVQQDIDFLKKSNEIKATEELNEMFHESVEIIDKEVIHYVEDNKLTTKVIIEANEDISKKQIIQN